MNGLTTTAITHKHPSLSPSSFCLEVAGGRGFDWRFKAFLPPPGAPPPQPPALCRSIFFAVFRFRPFEEFQIWGDNAGPEYDWDDKSRIFLPKAYNKNFVRPLQVCCNITLLPSSYNCCNDGTHQALLLDWGHKPGSLAACFSTHEHLQSDFFKIFPTLRCALRNTGAEWRTAPSPSATTCLPSRSTFGRSTS